MKNMTCLIILVVFALTACDSKPVSDISDPKSALPTQTTSTPENSQSPRSTSTPENKSPESAPASVSTENSQIQKNVTTKTETSISIAETPTLLKSDGLTPYQALSEIRKIEGFSGGTYAGVFKNGEYTFYLSHFFMTNPGTESLQVDSTRIYDIKSGNVKYYRNDKLTNYYNLFIPETYPTKKVILIGQNVAADKLKMISKLEQELYANINIYNVEWSPDYSVVAYTQGTEDQGEVFIWLLSEEKPLKVESDIYPMMTFFKWSKDTQFLLLDEGTSRQRGGHLYNLKTQQLSKGFSYLSRQFYFSPNSNYAAISKLSEFHAKAKEGYEDDQTEDLWLMDLSNFTEKIICKSDDHTDYFGLEWNSDNEFSYEKDDYAADTKQKFTIKIP